MRHAVAVARRRDLALHDLPRPRHGVLDEVLNVDQARPVGDERRQPVLLHLTPQRLHRLLHPHRRLSLARVVEDALGGQLGGGAAAVELVREGFAGFAEDEGAWGGWRRGVGRVGVGVGEEMGRRGRGVGGVRQVLELCLRLRRAVLRMLLVLLVL